MTDLATRRCVPCEGGVAPLSRAAAEEVLQRLDENWQLADDAATIGREFRYRDFLRTMSFVNALAQFANI
jgi:4a-hydroxytetrahydrobiopterin dehydratase